MNWQGHVDHFSNSVIVGWVYDSDNPLQTLTVVASAADGSAVRSDANLLRPDLVSAGIGTGSYGFALDISSWPVNCGDINIYIDGYSECINGVPYAKTNERHHNDKGPNRLLSECKDRWRWHIDAIDLYSVSGWACDMLYPTISTLVEARGSSGRKALTRANIYREDLLQNGIGDGRHGFVLDISQFSQEENISLHCVPDGPQIFECRAHRDAIANFLASPKNEAFVYIVNQLALEIDFAHALLSKSD